MNINDVISASENKMQIKDQFGREIWIPARPIDYRLRTYRERITEAWDVFTGKADSLYWNGGQ